jgi:hypothetical protein
MKLIGWGEELVAVQNVCFEEKSTGRDKIKGADDDEGGTLLSVFLYFV